MFFDSAKDARLQASIETQRTGYTHVVKPCKKYFGKDYIKGFTLVLGKRK